METTYNRTVHDYIVVGAMCVMCIPRVCYTLMHFEAQQLQCNKFLFASRPTSSANASDSGEKSQTLSVS